MTKNAALWLHTSAIDFNTITWPALEMELCNYFQPADFKHYARDKLANVIQTGKVFGYLNAFKCTCAKISTISDKEMLDRFVHGLHAPVQH